MSRRLSGGEIDAAVARLIEWAIAKAKQSVEEPEWAEIRARRYARPLRVRWLICGEGPVSLYSPIQAGSNPSSIYCVSHSVIHDETSLSINRLPEEALDRLRQSAGRKPRRAIEFAVRFSNLLHAHGGRARINRDNYMPLLLGTTNPNLWSRFKKLTVKAGIVKESAPPSKGSRSTEYELLVGLVGTGEHASESQDRGGVSRPRSVDGDRNPRPA
jgi:hypothetical protein